MSTFEENWETGAVVTAEAVSGIGFSGKILYDDEETADECVEVETALAEAAD